MIYGQWEKKQGKAVTTDPLGTHVVGTKYTPLKGGYGEDAWGRPIRDPYIFDLVFPNPRNKIGGWTPQVYTQGLAYKTLGQEALLKDLSKAKTVDEAIKMARGMGLPGPNEALAGSPGGNRIIPSTAGAYMMSKFYGGWDQGQDYNYKRLYPDDFWLFKNIGELQPDLRTILPRGNNQARAEKVGYGDYIDQYNNRILLKDGKRYVMSEPPLEYQADVEKRRPPVSGRYWSTGEYDPMAQQAIEDQKRYQEEWKNIQRKRGYIIADDNREQAFAPLSREQSIEVERKRGELLGNTGGGMGDRGIGRMPSTLPSMNEWAKPQFPKAPQESQLLSELKSGTNNLAKYFNPGSFGRDVDVWGTWMPNESDYERDPNSPGEFD